MRLKSMRVATGLGRCAHADIDRVPAAEHYRHSSSAACVSAHWESRVQSHGIQLVAAMHCKHQLHCLPSLLTPNDHLPAMQISAIQEICPEVTELEAFKALDMCSNR